MQPVAAAYPEFDRARHDAKAGPARGTRHFLRTVKGAESPESREQIRAARERSALRRCHRGEAPSAITTLPVRVGELGLDLFDATFDADLFAGDVPVEGEST